MRHADRQEESITWVGGGSSGLPSPPPCMNHAAAPACRCMQAVSDETKRRDNDGKEEEARKTPVGGRRRWDTETAWNKMAAGGGVGGYLCWICRRRGRPGPGGRRRRSPGWPDSRRPGRCHLPRNNKTLQGSSSSLRPPPTHH